MLTKIRRNVVAGILTFIPIWITFWVISFLVGVLVALGSPLVSWCVSSLGIHSPTLAEGRSAQWFQGTVSVAIVLAGLYLLGEIATAVEPTAIVHDLQSGTRVRATSRAA